LADDDRKYRFLVPPFFFGLSLLFGFVLSGEPPPGFALSVEVPAGFTRSPSPHWVLDVTAEQLGFLLTVIGASVLPLGFLLSSISILLIHLLFLASDFLHAVWRYLRADKVDRKWMLSLHNYEATLRSEAAWDGVYRRAGAGRNNGKDDQFALATFDHGLLEDGVNQWIQRRWQTFNIGVHSAVAVLLALIAGWLTGVPPATSLWAGVSIAIAVVFVVVAILAWRHTTGMLDFQARRTVTLESPKQADEAGGRTQGHNE
jgi:hypothetical protein